MPQLCRVGEHVVSTHCHSVSVSPEQESECVVVSVHVPPTSYVRPLSESEQDEGMHVPEEQISFSGQMTVQVCDEYEGEHDPPLLQL